MDMKRYENVLRKQTGKAVRPYRADGYVNVINRYGTNKDDTEMYFYRPDPPVPDEYLELFYESNGLFAKIIDTPAEEALKHGFELKDISDDEVIKFYESALDELDWVEVAMQGIKWARLYGGSLAIMLINDGHGLEEPVDWKRIKSIDDIVVYDRSMIMPDRTSMYDYDPQDPFCTRGSRLGTPEWYEIDSPTGTFIVHESRCLTFKNGVLPLNATYENYYLWGIPEYVRINRAIRNAEVAHESAPKMLSKSVQPVYKMKDLAMELATVEGEEKVLRRLEAIDMARGLLNSITIDAEGEDYSFQSFGFAGVQEVIDASCNWLSALTNIPQTILFGRSPAGMNATGQADFENYYNYVERIQQRMLRSNLRYLLSIIFTAGKHTGEIKEIPEINLEFNPLWSMTENEEVQLEAAKLQNEMTRAGVAGAYLEMGVIDPTEVRKELGKEDPIDPETMLNDMTEEELLATMPQGQRGAMGGMSDMGDMMGGGMSQMPSEQPVEASEEDEEELDPENYALEGNSPESAPEATKLPQDMNLETVDEDDTDHEDSEKEVLIKTSKEDETFAAPLHETANSEAVSWLIKDTDAVMSGSTDPNSLEWLDDEIKRRIRGVGVLVIDKNGKILSGIRRNGDKEQYGLLGGPGGHIEAGESFEDAAIRETYEEFGIVPKDLTFLALGDYEEESGMIPAIFLCTDWAGTLHPIDGEMDDIRFRTIDDILSYNLFKPFETSLSILQMVLTKDEEGGIISLDGFPGHSGRKGQVGGSLPKVSQEELDSAIAFGAVNNSKVRMSRQNRHVAGSDEYNKIKAVRKFSPSELTVSVNDMFNLYQKYTRTGDAYGMNGTYKEVIDVKQVIGNYVKDASHLPVPTTRVTVHYSSKGIHFVPAKP